MGVDYYNKYINKDKFNPDDHMKTESPLKFMYTKIKNKKLSKLSSIIYKFYNVSAMKTHQMTIKIGGGVRGLYLILFFLKVKLTSLNVKKMLLVVLEKQQLKILLNALIQHQEHLIMFMNALNQLNLHKLKNLN